MSQVFISVIAFIIAIGILISVHEFGHFWVARRFGIKVIRFSLGFGKPLFRWYDKFGTEYVLSLLPLGGYVSLFGERGQIISPSEQHMAFITKPVGVRMAVLLAGPLFNFLFAIVTYWIVLMMGVLIYIPILGNIPKDSIAGIAGLHKGQEIVAIDGKQTQSWEAVSVQLLAELGEDKTLEVSVREGKEGPIQIKNLDLTHWEDKSIRGDVLENLGLREMDPVPSIVGNIMPGYPGEKAGLLPGDKIVKVDGIEVNSRSEVIHLIQTKANTKVSLDILRQDHLIKIELEPIQKQVEDGKSIGFIGVEFPPLKVFPPDLVRLQKYGPLEALVLAIKKTYTYSILTLEMLKKMITGKISLHHVSGPLSIAKYAGQSVNIGLQPFLIFLAILSISLGVLNILPIPLLDGGHLMYCIIEIIRGRKVSEAAQNLGMLLGGIILIGFMALAFYNDFSMLLL